MDDKTRIVTKIIGNNEKQIDFMELRKGDLFTLTDPDGTPVTFKGERIFEALDDPYLNEFDTGEILMKEYTGPLPSFKEI